MGSRPLHGEDLVIQDDTLVSDEPHQIGEIRDCRPIQNEGKHCFVLHWFPGIVLRLKHFPEG